MKSLTSILLLLIVSISIINAAPAGTPAGTPAKEKLTNNNKPSNFILSKYRKHDQRHRRIQSQLKKDYLKRLRDLLGESRSKRKLEEEEEIDYFDYFDYN